ncbi:MAG: fibronectin type III domain-containing protein [Bacteriovoracaceae bacterium]
MKKHFFSVTKLLHFIQITLLSVLLSSCVGSVQDTKSKINELVLAPVSFLSFQGLVTAKAISHDKIEIEFFPMTGSLTDIRYLLYLNGSLNPIELNQDALDDATSGKKRYVVKNLNIATVYKLLLRAKNIKTDEMSSGETEITVTTFDNRTAEFTGINLLTKVVGATASSVKVSWVPAVMNGLFVATAYDPAYYEVTYISAGGAANLNNPAYAGVDRQVVRVPPAPALAAPGSNPDSVILNGLNPLTTYYVQVRAVNKLYYDFSINPNFTVNPVNRETNSRFLKITTEGATTLFNFPQESVSLQNAPGFPAYSQVNVFWSEASGTFDHYRVYWKPFVGNVSQVAADDQLTDNYLKTSVDFVNVDASDTSRTISGLSSYKWYQFKVVACKTLACPMDETTIHLRSVSNMKYIRTQAVLAPFSGITKIEHPKDATTLTKIKALFDPPSLAVGYADKLEMYCVDPNDYTRSVKMSSATTAASGIGNCDGLSLSDDPVLTDTFSYINGVRNTLTSALNLATYCFAATPAIRLQTEQKPDPLTMSDLVVRCISPEIKVPTLTEFPGLTGSCNVNLNSATVNWAAPTSGIYSNYRVFIKEIPVSANFKFSDAVATDTTYVLGDGTITGYESILLPSNQLTYTFTNLRPGKKYKVGVLSIAVDGASELNSEFNINIKECNVPMPTATFDEWTRLFAIGPKIDGRFPKASPSTYRDDAHIWESLNVDGIPYEAKMSGTNLDTSGFLVPPGFYATDPTLYSDLFDGKPAEKSSGVYVAASNQGIVSLAWQEVTLNFLDSEFQIGQDLGTRANRKYGYKIYRSDDNRLNWIDVSDQSKLVHARDFKFRVRSNVTTPTTKRMAFFTDYSVKYAKSSTAVGMDPNVDRGRTYWYKVVPFFDGKALTFIDSSLTPNHMIKITLPPPNVALVHRKMANRQGCLEIDKTIDKGAGGHYRCGYDGLGARPRGYPWSMTQTVLDQGGDLLVDRNEVGCQYTRGQLINDPSSSNSFYQKVNPLGAINGIADFKGSPTDPAPPHSDQTGLTFKGCAGSDESALHSTWGNHLQIYPANYKNVIWGDCLSGQQGVTMSSQNCSNSVIASRIRYLFPGAKEPAIPYDCSNNVDPTNPQTAYNAAINLLGEDFRRNLVIQSEFAAVFYSADIVSMGLGLNKHGPAGVISGAANLGGTGNNLVNNCYINLAAIGADNNWRARWFSSGELYSVNINGSLESIYNKTVGQVLAGTAIYDNANYKAPTASSSRYKDTTQIARVFSSNSSKLPPITGLRLQDAQAICNATQIEIGIGDDTTQAFLPTSFPVSKKLLNKVQFTTAAAFPDTENNHAQSLNYSDANITAIEDGTLGNTSCIDTGRANGGRVNFKDELIPQMVNYTTTPIATDTFIFSGSSQYDGSPGVSSDRCMSRYGIQDMIGNVWEATNFIMNCDYSKDSLYFGQYTGGNPVTGQGVGNKALSVPVNFLHGQSLTFIASNATIVIPATSTTLTNNQAWVDVDPSSGYCSIVDTDAARPLDPTNVKDPSGIFKNIFRTDGTLNTTVVPFANNVDQESVDYLRNGDGFFFNMGQNNFAPQLGTENGLSLNGKGITSLTALMAMGTYFNPLTGLPLSCAQSSCDGNSDNRKVTTAFFQSRKSPTDTNIQNFPIGNSQILNDGISDYAYGNSDVNGIIHYLFDATSTTTANRTIVTGFSVNGLISDPITTSYTTTDTSTLYGTPGHQDGDTIALTKPDFRIARNSDLTMFLGGGYNTLYGGRYSMKSGEHSALAERSRLDTGFRCGVLINTED